MSKERAKGTAEETRIVNRWNDYFGRVVARRTAASSAYDVRVQVGDVTREPFEVLATRADRGACLYTLREEDFLRLFHSYAFYFSTPVHIESKRYARFALHTIFFSKFGRKRG